MHQHDLLYSIQHSQKRDIVAAQGASLTDADGNDFLDFNEICIVLGQANEHFTKQLKQALDEVTSSKFGCNKYKERLYAYLLDTTRGDFRGIHLTVSGSETAEWAVKLAQRITGRTEVLSFWNSIHGRTHLSASMSGLSKRKTSYGPLAPGTVFGIYPDCHHCPLDKDCKNCDFYCLKLLDRKLAMESAQDIAAVIVEPYQGAGVICPPPGYLKALELWAHARGMLFIVDEVQSGMGRTGEMYVYQREGLCPDMLLLGKGLGNGLHISALMVKEIPQERHLHALTGGSGDNALACAAACAVFEELLSGGLLKHVASVGHSLGLKLEELAKNPYVSHTRAQGLASAVEFVSADICSRVVAELQVNRVITARYGSDTIMLKPPYTVTTEQVERVLAVIESTLNGLHN